MQQDSRLPFDLPAVARKKVSIAFDGGMLSSNAGVLLLRGVERRLGIAARLAACLTDRRDPDRIDHPLEEMLRLRMFAIAAGYEDTNDCTTLRHDPVFKMALGRAPESGEPLCSQPTMSRLENAPSRTEIARMMGAMVDLFCASWKRTPASISDVERVTLGEIGHRLGRKVLGDVATVALPDTILGWYRKLVARKFDGSKARQGPGRPRIKREVEQLIVRMATENRDWGYDRIVGALANLGFEVSDQTVGNVLQRHALPPAPERKRTTTWAEFIRAHLAVLAGTDFFTVEVLTLRGLVTYYVLFFIHLESRKVDIAGITVHPNEQWMKQMARNATMEGWGTLRDCRYLLHDRDTKYTQSFRAIIASGQVEPLALPARCPNLNAYAERWVRSVKEECLSKVILFGERSLRRALGEYVEHYHAERNHQGKGNVLLFPRGTIIRPNEPVQCRQRLGGLLRYYHGRAA